MTRKTKPDSKRTIETYEHRDKERLNNPPVGLGTPETDPAAGEKKTYAYDPHLDPQLVWAGKAERTSIKVPTVSLHVHKRIEPSTIMEAAQALAVRSAYGIFEQKPTPVARITPTTLITNFGEVAQ